MNVAVLAGGRSLEHVISVHSARQVIAHLDRARWQVWPVFIDGDGLWHRRDPLDSGGDEAFVAGSRPRRPGRVLDELIEAGVQVVFPVLHGRHGEDGTIQGMLELHDVPYVGSDTAASAVAMDKIRSREVFRAHGLPVAPAYVCERPLDQADAAAEAATVADRIGFPSFLKIDLSGSSYGVARAEGPDDVVRFITTHRGNGRRYLAERAVAGEEVSVPVLGNTGDRIESLPPVGIYPIDDPYFTPRAKYEADACEEVVPPKGLDAVGVAEVEEIARRCHLALCCDGMSRTDIIVGDDGPVVLEVNTIPGLTSTSLLPKSAAAVGIGFGALLDRLLQYALGRRRSG